MRGKRLRIILTVVLVIVVVIVVGLAVWIGNPYQPMPEALAALQSDETVTVQTDQWIVFRPAVESSAGVIFYPGGLVDARAYAPAMRAVAERGFLAVIVPMPLNLAVFNPNAADAVIAAFPAVERWVIAGHSLGGSMAARYADDRADVIDGLALWASYPASDDDLSDQALQVASVYGTADGVAAASNILGAVGQLPADAQFIEIEGGNHSQFGWYGQQNGDGTATISREEQQTILVDSLVQLLEQAVASELHQIAQPQVMDVRL